MTTPATIRAPDSLAELDQWIVWRYEKRDGGKPTKVPVTVEGKIPKGCQHVSLVSIAGTMRDRGCEYPAILAALLEMNASRLQIPAPEDNIKQIAWRVCQFQPGDKRGIGSV